MMLLALLLAYAGFTALSLAMERQHRKLWLRSASEGVNTAFRLVGGCLIVASLIPCVVGNGWPVGVTAWLGLLSIAIVCLVLLLAYVPFIAGVLALAATFFASLLIIASM